MDKQERVILEASAPTTVFACDGSAWNSWERLVETGVQPGDNLRIVTVPCSGRVDETMILAAVEDGARGVIVLGCPRKSCRYERGNVYAEARCRRVSALLDEVSLSGVAVEYAPISGVAPEELMEILRWFFALLKARAPGKAT